jgi:hypothetical protein
VVFLQVCYDVVGLLFGSAESVKDLHPMGGFLSGFFNHMLIGYIPVIRIQEWLLNALLHARKDTPA